jgi:hypothetical protein
MPGDGTAHYLRPAGRTFTPAAVIFADTESRQSVIGPDEVHTLRLWEAERVLRRDRRHPGQTDLATGETAEGFAAAVDSFASYPESTWLYFHNTSFDLTVTNLAYHLGQLGWVLSNRFAVGGDSMWCVFHKGARTTTVKESRHGRTSQRERVKWAHTLTIADSSSLFPCPLADLGPLVGLEKLQLPDDDDSDQAWAARCHVDVQILKRAVLELMDWWDQGQWGQWTVTGAGQAWQTYKSMLDPKNVVIDHDQEILDLERAALYGGRRDVFRVGDLPPGRYAEVDFEAAYPTIAANYPLPCRAACRVDDHHRWNALKGRVPLGMLAEVTISTPVPRWPVRINNRVFYPVGRFKTILAAPDIKAAADAGALEAVGDGWLFTMSNHLREWARTCLKWVKGTAGIVPPVVQVWAKLASRAVIGKFAQKGWRTEHSAGPPCQGWSVTKVSDIYTGVHGVWTGVNGEWWLSWADQRGEHERPAVLAFVEAHVRSRLGAIIDGPFGAAVTQCDTDGVMVSHTMMDALAADLFPRYVAGRKMAPGTPEIVALWNEQSYPLSMREKTQFSHAIVYGPQHVVIDGRPRFSGVPKGAWKTGESSWAARLWPGVAWQAQNASPGAYNRPVQPYVVAGPYAQAWVLQDGSVSAAETAINDQGDVILLEWKDTRWAAGGQVLGPRQGRWAEGLWDDYADATTGPIGLWQPPGS